MDYETILFERRGPVAKLTLTMAMAAGLMALRSLRMVEPVALLR